MKILVIEDNPNHYDIIESSLLASGSPITIRREDTFTSGMARIESNQFDVCLCDLQLPDSPIEQTIAYLSKKLCATPVIALTSLNSMDIASELIQNGVQDYLPKDEMSSANLIRACRYAIERKSHQRLMEEHNRDMDAFCSSLSHDFLGHIRKINQISGLIKSELGSRVELNEEDLEWFAFLDQSTQSISQLVSSLHQYLSIGHGHKRFEPINIKKLTEQLTNQLRQTRDDEFTIEFKGGSNEVKGNRSLLYVLLQNLIENGIKYNARKPKITIQAQPRQAFLELVVSDNGLGMSEQDISTIFRPFSRLPNSSDKPGSGLGLSIVKRVVEHHYGEIRVNSEQGKGTCFTLLLPLAS
jgi:signal transduction histidine kinase